MATNNMLHNASAYLKKSFLICGIKPHLICRMTIQGTDRYAVFFGNLFAELKLLSIIQIHAQKRGDELETVKRFLFFPLLYSLSVCIHSI